MHTDPFILVMGKSGCGKTTEVELSGLPCIQYYTTRPKRHPDETGHIFVTPLEFPSESLRVAYTRFAGYEYCATHDQVEKNILYVIDPDGAIDFLNHTRTERPIVVLYIYTRWTTRLWRMLKRGDKLKAFKRIWHDRTKFQSISELVKYKNSKTRLLTVDGTHAKMGSIANLLNQIYFKEV